MPSVRVKRGYTSLQDPHSQPNDNVVRRPRRRSVATALNPQVPPSPSFNFNESKTEQNDAQTRARASSVTGSSDTRQAHAFPVRPLRRPSSRISHHLMSSTRTPRAEVSQGPRTGFRPSRLISEDRDPFFPAGTTAGRTERHTHSLTHRHEDDDLISLQGSQTDVLVHARDREPGRVGSALSLPRSGMSQIGWDEEHHPDDIVEHLDVIDPQISTIATLTNAANAIVIPPLSFYSRKPVVVLPRRRRRKGSQADNAEKGKAPSSDEDDEDELDEHVEDVLRKRDRFRRVMQGVWSFVKTPLGFVTAMYGFQVVFWGTALVLFLARFINVHNDNTQNFWVEVCQQIETGLFSVTSIGLAPFRIVDTYRVYKIWYFKRRTEQLRRKAGLPQLYDPNDLPDPHYDANYVPVLTDKQQIELHYQQHMFMQSQTWYRPHGTQTHRAFPVDIAVWICVMNDLNTIFQILLSGCMWGMNRFVRPAWTTATTLPGAFVAGIIAGFLIYWGGRKTKRVKEVTERLRMALAMERRRADSDVDPERPEILTTGEGASRVPTAQVTRDSVKTLSGRGQKPQCKDFAEEDEDRLSVTREESQTLDTPVTPITPATPGVWIADEMTVPPAEELAGGKESKQQ